jgi:hypothetical protein
MRLSMTDAAVFLTTVQGVWLIDARALGDRMERDEKRHK